jgi:F-type H+-transporting ATPase subunit b
MNINWFTVIAQLLNFLLLVGLLKRFLYKPILNAIEERERKIESQLKEAELKKQEATTEQEEFHRKKQEIELARADMLSKSQAAAEEVRIQLMDEAREEIITLKNKWKDSFLKEQNEMNQQISDKIHQEVFWLTQKILIEISSRDLNEGIAEHLLQQLQSMNEVDRSKLLNAMSKTEQPVIVRSSEELSSEIRDRFKSQFDSLGKQLNIQFEIDPSLIGGLEILMTGFQISWNFRDYLASIEADAKLSIDNLFSQGVKVHQ